MIVSELVSLLGFKVNDSGARQFDATMNNLQKNATAVTAGIAASFAVMAVNIATSIGQAIGSGLAQIPKAGDDMTLAIAKVKSSLDESAISGGEAVAIYEKLYEIGTRTGVSAKESAQGFTQLQLAMKDMGYGASDTIGLLEGIQSAGIVAGQSTADVTEVVRQLGQAFGKGKLNGDELVTLSERMPRLVREIQKEMKMTTAQFFEASEKGKLTPELLAPALIKASQRSVTELSKFPMTMDRAMKIMANSAQRFLAELDKQFELSKNIAQLFIFIGKTLDSWRSGLSVIGDIVRELGGLQEIARGLGIILLVAFGSQIFSAVTGLVGLFSALGRAILVSLLPLAGFAAWVLIVEDFITWMQGGRSLFGERFGDFDKALESIKEQVAPFKAWFTENFNFGDVWENTKREFGNARDFFVNTYNSIKEAWNSNVEGMKPQFNWLMGVAGQLIAAFNPLKEFFIGVFGVIMQNFDKFYNKVVTVVEGITGAVRGLLNLLPGEGTGTGTDPAGQEERRKRMGGRGALGGYGEGPVAGFPPLADFLAGRVPDVTGAIRGGGPPNVNAPQTNTITNDITINAPGSDPASVASGVNSGMGRATDNMTTRLGNSFALGLGISSPRIESPAMP